MLDIHHWQSTMARWIIHKLAMANMFVVSFQGIPVKSIWTHAYAEREGVIAGVIFSVVKVIEFRNIIWNFHKYNIDYILLRLD